MSLWTSVLLILSWSVTIGVIAICTYLLALALAAYRFSGKHRATASISPKSIVVLIPAHNEEKLLGRTLHSILSLPYPRTLLRVVVLADNCSDSTASIARDLGVEVVERQDAHRKGKGHALNDFFVTYPELYERADILTVIDADTIVDPNYFTALSQAFSDETVHVVQGFYGVLNSGSSWLTRLTDVSLAIFHHLRPAGLDVLGGSTTLKGNGMAFRVKLIKHYGWPCTSLAEDLEMSLFLGAAGYPITYCPQAAVYADMPMTHKQATSQRQRWEQGRFTLLKQGLPSLLRRFIKDRQIYLLHNVVDLLIPPLSLTVYALGSVMLVNGFLLNDPTLWTAHILCAVSIFFYVVSGLILRKAKSHTWLALLASPLFLLMKVGIYLRILLKKQTEWIRTSRTAR